MQCMEKTTKRKADLENEQISATRTPKMEPESSKWLRRTSKKGPMSQQWRRLGHRRHLRRQRSLRACPWKDQMGSQTPIGDEKQANKGPTWVQKGIRKGSKSKTLEKLKIELPLQRELSSAHGRTPQMEPQNWVAHRKHKNEPHKALWRPI